MSRQNESHSRAWSGEKGRNVKEPNNDSAVLLSSSSSALQITASTSTEASKIQEPAKKQDLDLRLHVRGISLAASFRLSSYGSLLLISRLYGIFLTLLCSFIP